MCWMLRMIWGGLFTFLMLALASSEQWLGPGGKDSLAIWSCIMLFGWGPALLPLTLSRFFGAVWAWVVAIVLPATFGAPFGSTSDPHLGATFWGTLIAVGFGPLLIQTALGARKNAAFALGRSVLRDEAGRRADWTFQGDGVEVAVDLVRKELRIRARRAHWRETTGEWNLGPVEMKRPLLECAVKIVAEKKTAWRTIGATAPVTVNGIPTTVFVPTDSVGQEVYTGKYDLAVEHRKVSWEFKRGGVSRMPDGSLFHAGGPSKQRSSEAMEIELRGLPKKFGDKLAEAWELEVGPKIAALAAQEWDAFVARNRAELEDAFLRDESAARERAAWAKESARRRIDGLRAKADVGDEFLDIAHNHDGVVLWAIAADRQGRAVVIEQREEWRGSLADANAKASVELTQRGGPGQSDVFELGIELDDPTFERDHLRKRRFSLMRGYPKQQLVEWADRIQILSSTARGTDVEPAAKV
jgi:hypothetical protein